ncbi:MAG: hypothetical protein EKK37_16395 [Sphingobacteriales bacterium]|nr:MAG: hypothetical protein EKK37_16395 [Sphingobacteriales bacterium]
MEKKNGPIRALQILFLALLVGQLLFALLAFVLVKFGLFSGGLDAGTEKIFETVYTVIALTAVLMAFTLFKRKLASLREIISVIEKFNEYRKVCITKYAMLEGASLLSIIFFLVTVNYSFIIAGVILILVFMSQNPIRQRIKTELMVDDSDVDKMNQSE